MVTLNMIIIIVNFCLVFTYGLLLHFDFISQNIVYMFLGYDPKSEIRQMMLRSIDVLHQEGYQPFSVFRNSRKFQSYSAHAQC